MIRIVKVLGTLALCAVTVSCGKEKTKTVYVNNGQNPQAPLNQPSMPFPTDSSRQMDVLAVEITNFASVNGRTIGNGSQVEFRLRNSQAQIYGVQYKCVLEMAGRSGTVQPQDCSSPFIVETQQPGQYRFTVFAVHPQSSVSGHAAQTTFAVGQYPGGLGNSGVRGQAPEVQVGDLFLVTIPSGMHVVYRTSTFDQPGAIRRRMIDASMGDSAAPYPISCAQGMTATNFQQMVPDVTPMGQQLQYCETSLPMNYNAPSDFTMSYNSLGLSSDTSLGSQGMANQNPAEVPSKLYVNVFTQIPGVPPTNQFTGMFTNEFSATASRMQLSCGMNPPEYLGTAQIFQGYYAGQMAASHLYGCPSMRNGKSYINVAAFVVDQVNPLSRIPNCDWRCLREQNLRNQRAAEIVVEFGPFHNEVTARGQVRQAQEIMMNHIRKLTP